MLRAKFAHSPMKFSSENGPDLDGVDASNLKLALKKLGQPGNAWAVLESAPGHFVQASGNRSNGFAAEYRQGDEDTHHSSVSDQLTRSRIEALFLAYLAGEDWRSPFKWRLGMGNSGPHGRPARRSAPPRRSVISDLLHLLFLGIGLVFLGIALQRAADAWYFVNRGVQVVGTVTGFEAGTNNKSKTTHYPRVAYRDRSGEPHVLVMHSVSSFSPRSVGQQVPVLHDPDNPGEARVDNFGEMWGASLFTFGFGALFTVLTALQWKKTLPVRRRMLK